jgi:hypothetical protein
MVLDHQFGDAISMSFMSISINSCILNFLLFLTVIGLRQDFHVGVLHDAKPGPVAKLPLA